MSWTEGFMGVRLRASPIDLDLTLGCGQVFRWSKLEDGNWQGVIGDCAVTLSDYSGGVLADSMPARADLRRTVSEYLRLADDISEIQESISKDDRIAEGVASLRGLRLVKTDEWECLVSYVLATNANIPRISKMISTLAIRYGDPIGHGFNSFPTTQQLREASLKDLEGCGLGYRASYVHDICQQIDEGVIRSMKRMKYEQLRTALLDLPGVGDKVADCVSLFGFGRLEAFPIDVWIERALRRLYGVTGSYAKQRRFAADRFGPYAGYAQEYIYHNERLHAKSGDCLFTRPGGSCDRTP